MLAEAMLTPTESKKLISEAVFNLSEVQNALRHGIVAIHPSSSTVFLYEAITRQDPPEFWVCGLIGPKGLCGSKESNETIATYGPGVHDPLTVFKETWFFKKGVLQEKTPLGEILDQMTESDVFVKGCNALDINGKAGVLFGNPAGGGGTIGKVILAHRKKNFHLILPVGLEKLIPVSIAEASHKAGFNRVDIAAGLPCGLMPVPGRKIDERDALLLLSGAEATPIAAGGLGGAEGAIVLAVEGTEEQVSKAFEFMQAVKGAELPELHLPDCASAFYPTIVFSKAEQKAE